LTNPIEMVLRARRRIACLATIRVLICAALPLTVTVAIAIGLNLLNGLVFDQFGYLMDAAPARLFHFSLLGLALVELLAVALLGWRTWSHASDFIRTAEQIDRYIGGRQEIVTLASLSDPTHPEVVERRSPLFPVLSARVETALRIFDPRSAFVLEIRKPLVRSVEIAAAAVIILATAAFALMRRPAPAQLVSHRLQLLANAITASAPGRVRQQLASAARDVAGDVVDPKLPPQEKIAELRALEQEFQKFQERHQAARQGRGSSSGSGNGNGDGHDKGAGQGPGRGSGSDEGSGNSSTGSGVGQRDKAKQQMVELHNDIAKAQMKFEQELDSDNKTATAQNDSSKGTGAAPKPGSNPNLPGGENSANRSGQVPQPQALASAKTGSAQSNRAPRSDRGSMGDTHLGEFPKAGNYQRFYKLGEHGPAINIRDARYVTFQLPSEIESAGAGALVPDNTRPRASTPYTNAPLRQQRLPASPDEQQLVPPRYRELIR
jgi:hypothetical protein